MASEKRETFTLKDVYLVYPKVSKPDTFGPKADGKWKTDIEFRNAKREKAFKDHLDKKAKELMPKVKSPKVPGRAHKETGEVTFRLSSKFQPLVFDSKNNRLSADVLIGGGTRANVVGAYNTYDGQMNLYLNAVQVIELVEYKPKSREEYDSPFEATDGYEFEASETDTASDTGETANESSDEGDDALAF
jgi:hypothetical protein